MYNFSACYAAISPNVAFKRSNSNTYKFVLDSNISNPDAKLVFFEPSFNTDTFFTVNNDNFFNQSYDVWSGLTTYTAGTRVKESNNYYELLTETSVNEQPSANPLIWQDLGTKSQIASGQLETHSKNSLATLLQKVFNLSPNNKEFKEQSFVGANAGNGDEIVYNNQIAGRFVGFQINVTNKIGLTLDLYSIGTRFKLAQTLPVYLYDMATLAPIETWNIEVQGNKQFTIFDLPERIQLHYLSQKGSWLIGYYEDDLITGNLPAYTQTSCCSDSGAIIQYKNQLSRYVQPYASISEISIDNQYLSGTNNPVLHNNTNVISYSNYKGRGTNLYRYGLSLTFQNICDITKIIVDNAQMFAHAWKLQADLDLVNSILATQRNNFTAANRENAANIGQLFEKDLSLAIDSLRKNFSNIDAYGGSPCFASPNKGVYVSVR